MPDETRRPVLTPQEVIRRQLEPMSVLLEALQPYIGIQHLMAESDGTRALMRAALGSVEDLRRALQSITVPDIATELQAFRRLGAELEKQFLLPKWPEASKLLQALEMGGTARALAHYRDHESQCRHAIKAMTAPWLNKQNQLRSLTGLLGLQQIGHVLHTTSVFDVESAERLRLYLGDWQARIEWPSAIFTDPLVRSEFYLGRGLDPDLTVFPASAFDQAMTSAGVKRAPPPCIRAYGHVSDDERGEEDAGFERTNAAHDRLQRFESCFRAFIDQRMTATCGGHWIKHRVPGEMRQQWQDKRAKARDEGESKQRLIAYADFTDYVKIIVRKDNWKQVFASVFRRKSLVQESLQRLYPIRVCTMHARIITQDDELYLLAETKRLLSAIGIKT